MRIVLALGGNALLHRGEHPYPLDALNAQTQGLIGYWLVRELDRALGAKPTAALMTRVLVDRDDPAFAIPSKFVGESYGEGEAHALSPHTAGRWRPRTGCRGAAWSRRRFRWQSLSYPRSLTCSRQAARLCVVVAGESPFSVTRTVCCTALWLWRTRTLRRRCWPPSWERMCLCCLPISTRCIPTTATEHGIPIRHATAEQLRQLRFPAGSMGPKVQAACDFAEATGRMAAIGSISDALRVLAGQSGTQIHASTDVALRHEAEVHGAWAMGSSNLSNNSVGSILLAKPIVRQALGRPIPGRAWSVGCNERESRP